MNKKIIKFSSEQDPRVGFMSNSSNFGFTINNKRWKTVEHFLQAKKFEGTQFEEDIRLTPSVYQIKQILKPVRKSIITPSGKVEKRIFYGQKYQIRPDWNKVETRFIKQAINAKFDQNPTLQRRLFETYGSKIIDNSSKPSKALVKNLNKIRKNYKNSLDQSVVLNDKDISSSTLSPQQEKIVKKLIFLSNFISKLEGWDTIFPGMIEDAIYNLAPEVKISSKTELYDLGLKLVKHVTKFKNAEEWSEIYKKMPNFINLIKSIETMINKSNKPFQKVSQSSLIIAIVIRWLIVEATQEEKDIIFSRHHSRRNTKIILPQFECDQRPYRSSIPPNLASASKIYKKSKRKELREKRKLKIRKKSSRKINYPLKLTKNSILKVLEVRGNDLLKFAPQLLLLGGQFGTCNDTSKIYFNIRPHSKASIRQLLNMGGQKAGSQIIFTRPFLDEYRRRLLKLNGKYSTTKDKSVILFDLSKQEVLESFIAKNTSGSIGVNITSKYLDIIDASIQVAKLKKTYSISSEILKFVIENLFGFEIGKIQNLTEEINNSKILRKIFKENKPYKISSKSKVKLGNIIQTFNIPESPHDIVFTISDVNDVLNKVYKILKNKFPDASAKDVIESSIILLINSNDKLIASQYLGLANVEEYTTFVGDDKIKDSIQEYIKPFFEQILEKNSNTTKRRLYYFKKNENKPVEQKILITNNENIEIEDEPEEEAEEENEEEKNPEDPEEGGDKDPEEGGDKDPEEDEIENPEEGGEEEPEEGGEEEPEDDDEEEEPEEGG
ncbi:NADAR family protein [bacterium]|nr:NADAR family protein [bacterium]